MIKTYTHVAPPAMTYVNQPRGCTRPPTHSDDAGLLLSVVMGALIVIWFAPRIVKVGVTIGSALRALFVVQQTSVRKADTCRGSSRDGDSRLRARHLLRHKDGLRKILMLPILEAAMTIQADMPVDTVMRRWPETIPVFLSYRLRCVGCPIGCFHTVADACFEHGVDRTAFMAALREVVADGRSPAPRT